MIFKTTTIHPFFWLILPVLFILGQGFLEVSFSHEALAHIHSEGGPHEIFEFVFALVAFFIALAGVIKVDWKNQRLVAIWFLIAMLSTFYIAGEEMSWGQHILNWNTPTYWTAINDQAETNLHNTSAWLDQKPRLLLFIGIVVGGLIVPALRRWKPATLPEKYTVLYGPDTLVPAALGVLLPYFFESIADNVFHISLFERVSEVQELYMYYFVALYLWDLYCREIHKRNL